MTKLSLFSKNSIRKLSLITVFYNLTFLTMLMAQIGQEELLLEADLPRPEEVQYADIDGDGDEDIIAGASFGKAVYWFENLDGNGTYGEKRLISDDEHAIYSLFVADFDGDGDMDVCTATQHSQRKLSWFENVDGNGTFDGPIIISTVLDRVVSVYAVDVENDGDMDLLTASESDHTISWFRNLDGQGNFSEQLIISSNTMYAEDVYAADVDGDGYKDAITASGWDGKVRLHKFNPVENDFDFGSTIYNSQLSWPQQVSTGDIDGDGDLDIIAVEDIGDKIMWFENLDGAGNFGDANIVSNEIDAVKKAISADVDGDGDLDLLVGGIRELVWFENIDGEATFSSMKIIESPIAYPQSFSVSDFDNDNDVDLVVATLTGNNVFTYENIDGEGGFGNRVSLVKVGVPGVINLRTTDLNNDGKKDLVAIGESNQELIWIPQVETSEFDNDYTVICDTLNIPRSLSVADVNSDNHQDIIVTFYSYPGLVWFENMGDADAFSARIISDSTLNKARTATPADLDGDGDLDLLVAAENSDHLVWFENLDGQGNFGTSNVIYTEHNEINTIFAGDIDGDGDLDVAVSSSFDDRISWFENENGLGSFGDINIVSTSLDYPNGVTGRDIDQDGDMDLVAGEYSGNVLAWFENIDGEGAFGNQTIISDQLDDQRTLAVEDFDMDNDYDILVASSGSDEVYFFENLDAGQNFSSNLLADNFLYPYQVLFSDLDDDGDLEILTADRSLGKISRFNSYLELIQLRSFVYVDENENAIFDDEELVLKNQKIKLLPEARSVWTDENNSEAVFFVTPDLYRLTVDLEEEWQFAGADTTIIDLSTTSLDTQIVYRIGVLPNGNVPLVATSLTVGPTRCGFTIPLWASVLNDGNQNIEGGDWQIELPPNVTLVEAMPMYESQTGNTFSWTVDSLKPTEIMNVKLFLEMPGEDALGEQVSFSSSATVYFESSTNDGSDEFELISTINCAYDPNDKLVWPTRTQVGYDDDYIIREDTLLYTIRFQNTGTDTAFNIVVRDQLSTDLDWNTFKPLYSSHDFEATLHDNGLVEFYFNDIFLVDSLTNERESHGFVNFSILPISSIEENVVIENSAGIYFDFNAPIITNTVDNTFVLELPSILPPTAGFSYMTNELEVNFSNESTGNVSELLWDFGDGSTSDEAFPVHVYASAGSYEVCLTASNVYGQSQECQTVMVITTSIDEFNAAQFKLSPIPATDIVKLESTLPFPQDIIFEMYDVTGRLLVPKYEHHNHQVIFNVGHLPKGYYLLRSISSGGIIYQGSIILQ